MSNARDRGLDWLRSTGTGSSLRSPVRKVKVRPDVVSRHVRARGSLDDETRALAPLLMGDADHRHGGGSSGGFLPLFFCAVCVVGGERGSTVCAGG